MSKDKMTQDEALGQRLEIEFNKLSKTEYSKENIFIEIAGNLRKEVIDPAVIAGSVKLLKAHRNALYDSCPTDVDLDAMDLLNIIQNHLQKVDASIAGLEKSLKPQSNKPLDNIQEAEIVEPKDENKKA